MFKRKLISIITASVLVFGLTACATEKPPVPVDVPEDTSTETPPDEVPTADGDTIVIGGIGPLTGDVSIYGEPTLNGAQLFFEENAKVLGKTIIFKKLDDKGDPTDAVNAFNKLYEQDKAVGIIGAVTSKPSSAVAVEANNVKIPMITPSGTALDITTNGDGIFRACFLDSYQSETLAQYAADQGLKTAAILYDKGDDYSTGLAEVFQEKFTSLGGEIVDNISFGDTDADFNAQLTKIKEKTPDILFIPAYYSKVALIALQARNLGIDALLMGADGWDGVLEVVTDASVVENAIFTNHFVTSDPDPKVQNFVQKYKEAYGKEPNAFAALGYDAAGMMYKAIEDAGATDGVKIAEALQKLNYKGVTSVEDITFDAGGNPIKGISIIEIIDGKNTLKDKYFVK